MNVLLFAKRANSDAFSVAKSSVLRSLPFAQVSFRASHFQPEPLASSLEKLSTEAAEKGCRCCRGVSAGIYWGFKVRAASSLRTALEGHSLGEWSETEKEKSAKAGRRRYDCLVGTSERGLPLRDVAGELQTGSYKCVFRRSALETAGMTTVRYRVSVGKSRFFSKGEQRRRVGGCLLR